MKIEELVSPPDRAEDFQRGFDLGYKEVTGDEWRSSYPSMPALAPNETDYDNGVSAGREKGRADNDNKRQKK